MRYAKIKYNDIANTPGICVSVYLQGCAKHCKGCHNPETWDFDGGYEFTADTMQEILNALTANGVNRSLAILGGEPLHPRNLELTNFIITQVKSQLPKTKIYIWTGYKYEELLQRTDEFTKTILEYTNTLIDGEFILEQRDITLKMRGSANQRIINLKE